MNTGCQEGDSTAEYMLMSKQMNGALNQAGLPPKDFTAVSKGIKNNWKNSNNNLIDLFVQTFHKKQIAMFLLKCYNKVNWKLSTYQHQVK